MAWYDEPNVSEDCSRHSSAAGDLATSIGVVIALVVALLVGVRVLQLLNVF